MKKEYRPKIRIMHKKWFIDSEHHLIHNVYYYIVHLYNGEDYERFTSPIYHVDKDTVKKYCQWFINSKKEQYYI